MEEGSGEIVSHAKQWLLHGQIYVRSM
jgi:hypothetical protein